MWADEPLAAAATLRGGVEAEVVAEDEEAGHGHRTMVALVAVVPHLSFELNNISCLKTFYVISMQGSIQWGLGETGNEDVGLGCAIG